MWSVAARGATLVAVGTDGDPTYGPAAAWVSTDGTWRRAEVAGPDGVMRAVTSTADGFVAVGYATTDDGARVWRSADGTTWSPVDDQASLDNHSSPIRMLSVAADERGLVAGGWRADAANGSSAAWTSPDGVHWTAAPWVPAFSGGQIPGVAARGRPRAGRRAVGLPGQQPGRRLGQPPAMSRMGPRGPAAVTLVSDLSLNDLLWVANTGHGPAGHWHARVRGEQADHDHLADPAAARAYLADHGVPVPPGPPDPASLARLRLVREVDPAAPRAGRQPVDRGHDGAARRRQVPPRRAGPDRRRGRRLAGVRREPRARPDRPRRPARSPRPVRQPRLPADVPRRHAQPGAPVVRPDGLRQPRAGRPGARTDTVAGAGRHARRGSWRPVARSPGSPAVQPPR